MSNAENQPQQSPGSPVNYRSATWKLPSDRLRMYTPNFSPKYEKLQFNTPDFVPVLQQQGGGHYDMRDAYPPLSPVTTKKTKASRGYTYFSPTTNSPTEEVRTHSVSPLATANRTDKRYFEATLSPQPLFLSGFAEAKPDQVAFGKPRMDDEERIRQLQALQKEREKQIEYELQMSNKEPKNDKSLTFGSTPVLLEKSIPYYLARYEQQNAKQPAKSIMKEPRHGEIVSESSNTPTKKFYIPIEEMEVKPKPVEPKTKAVAPSPQKQAPAKKPAPIETNNAAQKEKAPVPKLEVKKTYTFPVMDVFEDDGKTEVDISNKSKAEEQSPRFDDEMEEFGSMDEPVISPSSDWSVELGVPGATTNLFDFTVDQKSWYLEYFQGKPHANLILNTDPPGTPLVVSIMREENQIRAVIRSAKATENILIPEEASTKKVQKAKQLLKKVAPTLQFSVLREVREREIMNDLITFEKRQISKQFKIGVLYRRRGQKTEEELFDNSLSWSQPAYEEFLSFLGDKVPLKGWQHYNGGLDISDSCSSGTHSIYTKYRDNEIMFHVSTMLPHSKNDTQQVERKRYLGSDIVNIVFQEGYATFHPDSLTAAKLHVIAVVQKVEDLLDDGVTRYRCAFASKVGVPPFGPELPDPALFEKDEQFRNFLLSKLINGENAALQSPYLASKFARERVLFLKNLESTYCKGE